MSPHDPTVTVRALLDLERQLVALRAERDALRKALARYGKHPESCPKGVGIGFYRPPGDARCTCGIDAALAAQEADRG